MRVEYERADQDGLPPDTPALIKRVAMTATPIVGDSAVLCPSTVLVNRANKPSYYICSTQFVVLISPVKNAHLDLKPLKRTPQTVVTQGGELSITSALIRILTQDELAFVISHELAHHVARHNLDNRPIVQMEVEADRIAIFLMARSGYDTNAALMMLNKVADENTPPNATHPDFSERLSRIALAIAEVERLKQRGAPLVP